MIKRYISLGLLFISGSLGLFARNKQPNIVLFIVDDMGWQDTSLPFWTERTPLNDLYHTPNMERLANQGMKFTQAYACAISSPSRVSLLTGMNAARHRVTNWTLHRNVSVDKPDDVLEFPDWNVNGLSPFPNVENTVEATVLPELLRKAGYHTIHVGKAHFGAIGTPAADPLNLGYDVNIAGHAAGAQGSYLGEDDYGNRKKNDWGVPGMEEYFGQDMFLTEGLTIKALRELDKAKDSNKPFFLYMSHYAVHIPFSADNRFVEKYRQKGLPELEAQYAALLEGMDKSLGDVMDYLEKNNLENNTVIFFVSDNGGLSAHGRGGKLNTHNLPLASGKGSAYEGGIRVPMIVKWNGVVSPNSVQNNYVMIEDFFPTILDIADVHNPRLVQKTDGISFLPSLKGYAKENCVERALFWHFPNKWGVDGPGIEATSIIRKEDWKLIYFHKDNHFELYNISKDIGEHNDLSESAPQKVESLAEELENYLISVDAQMPINKSSKKIVPMPYTYLKTKNL